jgi:hypothetical protein
MDSRSGLTEFPLAPVETNDSKSYLAKVPSVTCMVVVQASSRVCYHIDATGDRIYNVDRIV